MILTSDSQKIDPLRKLPEAYKGRMMSVPQLVIGQWEMMGGNAYS